MIEHSLCFAGQGACENEKVCLTKSFWPIRMRNRQFWRFLVKGIVDDNVTSAGKNSPCGLLSNITKPYDRPPCVQPC